MKRLATRVDELISGIYKKAGAAAKLVRHYIRKLVSILVSSKNPGKRIRETIEDLEEAADRPPRVKDARAGRLVLELKQEKGVVVRYVVEGLKAVSSLVAAAALYKGVDAYVASQRPRSYRELVFSPLGQGSGLMAAATGLSGVFLSNLTREYGKAAKATGETYGQMARDTGAEIKSTIEAATKAPSKTVKEFIPTPKLAGSMLGKVLGAAMSQAEDARQGFEYLGGGRLL